MNEELEITTRAPRDTPSRCLLSPPVIAWPIDVSGAAGRQQDRLRPGHTDRPVLGQIPDPGAAPLLDHQVDDLGVRVRPDPGHGRHPLVEHAPDLAAGRIARVQHPPHAVRPLDAHGDIAPRRIAPQYISYRRTVPISTSASTARCRSGHAGRQGVRSVELGRVLRATAEAMPPSVRFAFAGLLCEISTSPSGKSATARRELRCHSDER